MAASALAIVFAVSLTGGPTKGIAASLSVTNDVTIDEIESGAQKQTPNRPGVYKDGAFVLPITPGKVKDNPLLFDFSSPRFLIEPMRVYEQPYAVWHTPFETTTSPLNAFDGSDENGNPTSRPDEPDEQGMVDGSPFHVNTDAGPAGVGSIPPQGNLGTARPGQLRGVNFSSTPDYDVNDDVQMRGLERTFVEIVVALVTTPLGLVFLVLFIVVIGFFSRVTPKSST